MNRARTFYREMRKEAHIGWLVLSWTACLFICTYVWTDMVDPSYGEWRLRQWAGPIIMIGASVLDLLCVALVTLLRHRRRDRAFIAFLVREGILPPDSSPAR